VAPRKRPNEGSGATAPSPLKDSESIRDLAEPYRLATAKFSIDSLTPIWSDGTNRPIDRNHVMALCRLFQSGIRRRRAQDRFIVVCAKRDVERMLARVTQHGGDGEGEGDAEWPSFHDWVEVVGAKAELAAGNHRAEALKEYMRRTKASADEGWWICDVYDRGECLRRVSPRSIDADRADELPHELHLKLRANREDSILPDTHGQIWAELATLSSKDETLFVGTSAAMEQQILEKLGLNGRARFPIKRLCTLWKNSKWKEMMTRWCQSAIGRLTFNLSTCEWMAGCRIDEVSAHSAVSTINMATADPPIVLVRHIQRRAGVGRPARRRLRK
jgi:hypothetical protein